MLGSMKIGGISVVEYLPTKSPCMLERRVFSNLRKQVVLLFASEEFQWKSKGFDTANRECLLIYSCLHFVT